MVELDKRRKMQPHIGMKIERRNFVIVHIKKFPRYRSDYSKKDNTQFKYFHQI